jgi:hypothetical protein
MIKELEHDIFNILLTLGKLYNTEENRQYVWEIVAKLLKNNYVLLGKIYNYFVKCDMENNPNDFIECVDVYIEVNQGESVLVCNCVISSDSYCTEFNHI